MRGEAALPRRVSSPALSRDLSTGRGDNRTPSPWGEKVGMRGEAALPLGVSSPAQSRDLSTGRGDDRTPSPLGRRLG